MIEFRTLGAIDLRSAEGESIQSVAAQPKRLALLAYLAIANPRGRHRRDTLLGVFWSDLDQSHARAALRKALHYIRRSLGAAAIETLGDEEVGLAPGELRCDATAFGEAVQAGQLERALSFYQGDLLEGFKVPGAPEFESWLERERGRLRRLASQAAWALAEREVGDGNRIAAARWARRASEISPYDEAALSRLLVLLDQLGDRAGALHAFDEFARRLKRELELEPAPETLAVIHEIRNREPQSRQRESGPPVSIVGSDSAPGARPNERSRFMAPAVVVALAALALGIGLGTALLRSDRLADTPDTTTASSPFRPPWAAAGNPSPIAVLPAANIGGDAETEYFSEGITHDIVLRLSKISGLKVISPTSTARFRDRALPVREIGEELGVAHILEANVRLADDRVRIITGLIDTRSEELVWVEEYDRELTAEDLFAVQGDVALQVASALEARLTPGERNRIEHRPTSSIQAYALYLKGRFYWNRSTPESARQATELYREALAIDEDFAQAIVGLAETQIVQGQLGTAPPEDWWPPIREAVNKALDLDDSNSDALALSGNLAMIGWDWVAAEAAFRRAIELNPSSEHAHLWYAQFLSNMGRHDEAVATVERARELAPFSPFIHANLGARYYFAGRFEQAQQRCAEALKLFPDHPIVWWVSGMVLGEVGDPEEAIEVLQRARELMGDRLEPLPELGLAYARAGRISEAREVLAEIEEAGRDRYVPSTFNAKVLLSLGEHEDALDRLERAFREWEPRLTWVPVDPHFRLLRSHPRFIALLGRMGLQNPAGMFAEEDIGS